MRSAVRRSPRPGVVASSSGGISSSSVGGDVEYAFWHVLTREAAYARMPRAARARKHAAAAAWIEQTAGERVADPTAVDPRFLVDDSKLDAIAEVVRTHWPVEIDNADLQAPTLIGDVEAARSALLDSLGLHELA